MDGDWQEVFELVKDDVTLPIFKVFGRKLGLKESELDSIISRCQLVGLRESVHQILLTWRNKNGSNATLEELARILISIELRNTAEKIIPDLQLSNGTCQSSMFTFQNIFSDTERTQFEKIVAKLNLYYRNPELPGVPWIDLNLPMDELYVELTLHQMNSNGIENDETTIKLEELFSSNPQSASEQTLNSRILVEASPGYGKTTLLIKIANDWEKGAKYIKDRFDIVILLYLREFYGSLKQKLKEELQVDGVKDPLALIEKIQHRACLLLDGFDELPDDSHQEVMKLLKGTLYPKMTVLLTSRRMVFTERGMRFWNRRIEIKGITDERKRSKFLEHYLNLDSEQVARKLSQISAISNDLLECPLFLLLIAIVIDSIPIHSTITKTELYKTVMQFAMTNSLLRDHLISRSDAIDVFSHLHQRPSWFTRAFGKSYYFFQMLIQFGELALEKLRSKQLLFDKSEILKQCKKPDVLRFGFLTMSAKQSGRLKREVFEPVHKSFLEFLAALYLATIIIHQDDVAAFTHKLRSLMFSGLHPESYNLVFTFLNGFLKNKKIKPSVLALSDNDCGPSQSPGDLLLKTGVSLVEEAMEMLLDLYHDATEVDQEVSKLVVLDLSQDTQEFWRNAQTLVLSTDDGVDILRFVPSADCSINSDLLICQISTTLSKIQWQVVRSFVHNVSASRTVLCIDRPPLVLIDDYVLHEFEEFSVDELIMNVFEVNNFTEHIFQMIIILLAMQRVKQKLTLYWNSSLISNEMLQEFFRTVIEWSGVRECNLVTTTYVELVRLHRLHNEVSSSISDKNVKVTLACKNCSTAEYRKLRTEIYPVDANYDLSLSFGDKSDINGCFPLQELGLRYSGVEDLSRFERLQTLFLVNLPAEIELIFTSVLKQLRLKLLVVYIHKGFFKDIYPYSYCFPAIVLTSGGNSEMCEGMSLQESQNKHSVLGEMRFLSPDFTNCHLMHLMNLVYGKLKTGEIGRCSVVGSNYRHEYIKRLYSSDEFRVISQVHEPTALYENFPTMSFYKEMNEIVISLKSSSS